MVFLYDPVYVSSRNIRTTLEPLIAHVRCKLAAFSVDLAAEIVPLHTLTEGRRTLVIPAPLADHAAHMLSQPS